MPGAIHFPLFLLSCLILSATPGPATMYLLGRTLSQGRTVGIQSVLGVSTGTIVYTILTAAGLSAILAASATAFTGLKLAGAGYLVFLGLKTILTRSGHAGEKETPKKGGNPYFQGLVTQVLNPKLGAFMISFLPQFVDPLARGTAPFLELGLVLALVDTVWYLSLVTASAKAASAIRRHERALAFFQRWVGLVYVALGLNLLRARRTP